MELIEKNRIAKHADERVAQSLLAVKKMDKV